MQAHWDGNGIERLTRAGKKLSSFKRQPPVRRAVNNTGDKANAAVRPVLARQVGLSQSAVAAHGNLSVKRAGSGLIYQISSTGGHLSLKLFGPKQGGSGTSASPWGRRQMFGSAFMGPRPGTIAGRLGGHVYRRTSDARFPIKMMYGPSVPRELTRDKSAESFIATTATSLPRDITRHVRVLTNNTLS